MLDEGYPVRGTVRSVAKGEYLTELFKGSQAPFEYVVVEDIAKVSRMKLCCAAPYCACLMWRLAYAYSSPEPSTRQSRALSASPTRPRRSTSRPRPPTSSSPRLCRVLWASLRASRRTSEEELCSGVLTPQPQRPACGDYVVVRGDHGRDAPQAPCVSSSSRRR
jgi:hypothetical protein